MDPIVMICWMGQYQDGGYINTLAYGSGKGSIRTFYKDNVDPRCLIGADEKLPYFNSSFMATIWMARNRDQLCQIDIKCADDIGFCDAELAMPELHGNS